MASVELTTITKCQTRRARQSLAMFTLGRWMTNKLFIRSEGLLRAHPCLWLTTSSSPPRWTTWWPAICQPLSTLAWWQTSRSTRRTELVRSRLAFVKCPMTISRIPRAPRWCTSRATTMAIRVPDQTKTVCQRSVTAQWMTRVASLTKSPLPISTQREPMASSRFIHHPTCQKKKES